MWKLHCNRIGCFPSIVFFLFCVLHRTYISGPIARTSPAATNTRDQSRKKSTHQPTNLHFRRKYLLFLFSFGMHLVLLMQTICVECDPRWWRQRQQNQQQRQFQSVNAQISVAMEPSSLMPNSRAMIFYNKIILSKWIPMCVSPFFLRIHTKHSDWIPISSTISHQMCHFQLIYLLSFRVNSSVRIQYIGVWRLKVCYCGKRRQTSTHYNNTKLSTFTLRPTNGILNW